MIRLLLAIASLAGCTPQDPDIACVHWRVEVHRNARFGFETPIKVCDKWIVKGQHE